jgi:hypothetical protein
VILVAIDDRTVSKVRRTVRESQAREKALANPDVDRVKMYETKVRRLETKVKQEKALLHQELQRSFSSVSDASFILGVTAMSLVGKIRLGQIIGMKIGRHWYMLSSSLTDMVEEAEWRNR